MSMSLGPLEIAVQFAPEDVEEVKEMLDSLQADAKQLPPGSDARMILWMIIGDLEGQIRKIT